MQQKKSGLGSGTIRQGQTPQRRQETQNSKTLPPSPLRGGHMMGQLRLKGFGESAYNTEEIWQ